MALTTRVTTRLHGRSAILEEKRNTNQGAHPDTVDHFDSSTTWWTSGVYVSSFQQE